MSSTEEKIVYFVWWIKNAICRNQIIRERSTDYNGPYSKIRTAQKTNKNSPFHKGPVQPYNNSFMRITSLLLTWSATILFIRISSLEILLDSLQIIAFLALYTSRPFIGLPFFRTCRVISKFCALIVLRSKRLHHVCFNVFPKPASTYTSYIFYVHQKISISFAIWTEGRQIHAMSSNACMSSPVWIALDKPSVQSNSIGS